MKKEDEGLIECIVIAIVIALMVCMVIVFLS